MGLKKKLSNVQSSVLNGKDHKKSISAVNLIPNSDFSQGTSGWVSGIDPPHSNASVDFSSDWMLEGGHTAYLFATQDAARPSIQLEKKIALPVQEEGVLWRLAGLIGLHRADLSVELSYFTNQDVLLETSLFCIPCNAHFLGGRLVSGYRSWVAAPVVPAGASAVTISLHMGHHSGDGQAFSFAFFTHLFFGVVPSAESTEWLPVVSGAQHPQPLAYPVDALLGVVTQGSQAAWLVHRWPVVAQAGQDPLGAFSPIAIAGRQWLSTHLQGRNLVQNADFSNGWTGWAPVKGVAGDFGVDFSSKFKVFGGHTAYWFSRKEKLRAKRVFIAFPIPVWPGFLYELCGYVGYHRCDAGLGLEWLDQEGLPIGEESLLTWNPHKPGGIVLSDYDRQSKLVLAPASACYARLFVEKGDTHAGYDDSFVFLALPFFGVARQDGLPCHWSPTQPGQHELFGAVFTEPCWLQSVGFDTLEKIQALPGVSPELPCWRYESGTDPMDERSLLTLASMLQVGHLQAAVTLLYQLADVVFDKIHPTTWNALSTLFELEERLDDALLSAFLGWKHSEKPLAAHGVLSQLLRASSYGSLAHAWSAWTAVEPLTQADGFAHVIQRRTQGRALLTGFGLLGIAGNSVRVWRIDSLATAAMSDLLLHVDGTAVEVKALPPLVACMRPKVPGLEEYVIRLPDAILDNQPHELALSFSDSTPFAALLPLRSFKPQCVGRIDVADYSRVAGWVVDLSADDFPLELELLLTNGLRIALPLQVPRDDVAQAYEKPIGTVWGFDVHLDLEPDTSIGMQLCLAGSDVGLLDTARVLVPTFRAVAAVRSIGKQLENSGLTAEEVEWLRGSVLPALLSNLRGQSPMPLRIAETKQCQSLPSQYELENDEIVDVIIPVYADLNATRACLESVVNAVNEQAKLHVVIIDDCTPEPELARFLEDFCKAHAFELRVHPVNLGFVRTVNEGMALHPARDVVLLNADAIVADGWLDGLRQAAHSGVRIASATPLSNNATIFSYPIMGIEQPLPEDISLKELAAVARTQNAGNTQVVPTCHGFCAYLRRDALIDIGLFDAETWRRGYGEETDWSQKARDRGWQHVAAPAVFVEHLGSRSFKGDRETILMRSFKLMREKYPEYDYEIQRFLKDDPLASFRRPLDLYRLECLNTRFVLHISHHLGGGTQKHVDDLCRLSADGLQGLCLTPDRLGTHLVLTCPALEMEQRYRIGQDDADLRQIFARLDVAHVHVHHLLGYPDGWVQSLLTDCKLKYRVTLHDYAAFCPRIFLCRPQGDYCGGPYDDAACEACVSQHGAMEPAQPLFKQLNTVAKWRAIWGALLAGADQVITPTVDMQVRIRPWFAGDNLRLLTHPESTFPAPTQPEPKARLTVALLGGLSWEKGLGRLIALATLAKTRRLPIDFVVIGNTADDAALEKLPNVSVHGRYKTKDSTALIQKYQPDVVLFLSVWPETWCYTLSEAMYAGAPVLAPDLGAFGERLRQSPRALYDANTDDGALLDRLLECGPE